MKYTVSLVLSLLLASLALLPAQAESIARYLPADTLVHLTLTDGKQVKQALKQVALARLLQEKEVQLFIDELSKNLGDTFTQFEKELGLTYYELFALFQGEVSLTVTGISAAKNPVLDRLLLTAELGDKGATYRKVLSWLKQKISQADKTVRFGSYELKQCKVQTIRLTGVTLSTAFYKGRFFAATDGTALAELLGKLDSKPRDGLAGKPLYRQMKQQVTRGQPGLHLYLDLAGILKKVLRGPGASDQRKKLAEFGVDQIQALAIGSTISKRGFVERVYVHAPKATRGLFSMIESLPETDRDVVRLLPEKSLIFQVGALNPLQSWLSYLDFVQRVAPEEYKQGYQSLYQFEKSLGLKVPQLLRTFGKRFAFYVTMPENEGLAPHIVLMMETEKPQQLRETLNQLIQRMRRTGQDYPALDIRKIPFDDSYFHYLNLSRLGGQQVIAPAFAIRGNWFLLAQSPLNLKAAWVSLANKQRQSMADTPRFKLISEELSPRWGSMGYLDAGRGLVAVYETFAPLFQALIPQGDVPFEPALIPMPSTLAKHLYGVGWATYKTREGVRIELASPIGVVAFLASAVTADLLGKLVKKQQAQRASKDKTPQVSYNYRDMPLTEALDNLARKSGVTILYTRKALSGLAVTGEAKQMTLGSAMARLLPPSLAYRIRQTPDGKLQVVVYKAASKEPKK